MITRIGRKGRIVRRVIGALGLLADPEELTAQQRPPFTNEIRVDARFSRNTVIEVGGSFVVPAGIYARTALTAALGYATRDSTWRRAMRVEVTSRFLLDPFRESRYGLSVGGGVGMTNAEGLFSEPNLFNERSLRWRPYLAVIVDLELRKTAGWTPAVQVGLGGGLRLGFLVRSSTDRWR